MKYGKSKLLSILRLPLTRQMLRDLVDSLWRDPLAGGAAVSGLGMDFTTGNPVDMGTPSTIDSTTTNALTETSHTHALGTIDIENIVSGVPVEYGALYNTYVIIDDRKISSSDDWVIDDYTGWDNLRTFYGGSGSAGSHLKEAGLIHWSSPNSDADNSSLLGMVGGGQRNSVFQHLKSDGYYHRSDTGPGYPAAYVAFSKNSGGMFTTFSTESTIGYSIRFANYSTVLSEGETGIYTGNDGKTYPTICRNGVEYLAANLNETKYRNGDWITGYDGGVYTPMSDAAWGALETEAMCYYNDNEAYGGGQTPMENTINNLQSQINELAATPASSTYIDLTDTSDTTYTAKDLHVPIVNEATSNLDLTPTELATFLILNDTPSAYTGAGGKLVAVKSDVSGLEFVTQLTLPVKASGSELNTGTDDAKFATAKALKDGEFIGIHVGTSPPSDTTMLWLDTN